MPPQGQGLSSAELDILRRWIAGGLLDTTSSVAKKVDKPKVDLNIAAGIGKPQGPIAKPEHLLLEPVLVTPRSTAITALAASPWTSLVAIAATKQILLYDTENYQLTGILPYTEGYARSLKFSASGSLLVLGGGRGGKLGHAIIFDVKTGRRLTEIGHEPDTVQSADISPDHTKVVIGCTSKKVKCYDLTTGEELYQITKHTDWILGADFSPDGILLASCDRNGNVFVWEADNGGEFYLLGQHKDSACVDIAWRADSNLLASIGKDGIVYLWEMTEGKQVKTWKAHVKGAEAISFTPSGDILTCGTSGIVKLWDVTGKAKGTWEQNKGILATDIVALHDSKSCLTADWNGAVRLVSLQEKMQTLAELSSNPSPISQRIQSFEQQVKELTPKITPAKQLAEHATTKANEATQQLKGLQERLAHNKQRQQALPQELKQIDEQLQKAKAKQQLLKTALTAKLQLGPQQNIAKDFQQPLSEQDKQIKALTEKQRTKLKEQKAAEDIVKADPAHIISAQALLKKLQTEATEKQASWQQLQNQLNLAQRQIPSLHAAQFNLNVLSEREKLLQLEANYQAYTNSLVENQAAHATSKANIEKSHAIIQASQTAQPALEAALRKQLAELPALERAAATSQAEADKLVTQVQEQQKTLAALEAQLAKLIKQKEEGVASANQAAAEIDQEVQRQTPGIANLQKKLERPNQIIQEHQANIQKLQAEKAPPEKCKPVQDALTAAHKEAEPLLAQLKKAENKITQSRSLRQEKRDLPAKLEREHAIKAQPLLTEISTAKNQIEALQKDHIAHLAQAKAAKQQRDAKHQQRDQAKLAAEQNRDKKAQAESALARATADVPQREKSIAEAQAELAKLHLQLAPMRAKVKKLTEQYLAMLPK